MLRVPLKQLDPDLPMPTHAYEGDAGCDLYSAVEVVIGPGERALVPTGIALAIPPGFAGFIQPRSGLALRHGISMVNTPGLIDAHYRGEIKVLLLNTDREEPFAVRRGDKICQLVIQRVEQPLFEPVLELEATVRGGGGFGSSGV